MENKIDYNDFLSFMSDFDYRRLTVNQFHDVFNSKVGFATKNQLTKWMQDFCDKNGYDLIRKKTNNTRIYEFERKIPVRENILKKVELDDIKSINVMDYISIEHELIEHCKLLLKYLKYRFNGKFRIKTDKVDGVTRLFRLS